MGRQSDIRRDMHVAERELSTVGTKPHEACTRNAQNMTESALQSVNDPQQKEGSAGKSSLVKQDVGSTNMALPRKLARKTDNMGAKAVENTARLRKSKETTPAEWWRERHKKGHITIDRYEMDHTKKDTWQGQTQKHQGHSEQEASNDGETHKS